MSHRTIFDEKILSEFESMLSRDIPTRQTVEFVMRHIRRRAKKILLIESRPEKWHLIEREFGELLAREGLSLNTPISVAQSMNRLIRFAARNHPELFENGIPQPIRPFSRARVRDSLGQERLSSSRKFISDHELAEIENLLPDRVKPYFKLSLAYGLRRNEAVALCGLNDAVRQGFLLVDRQFDFETGDLKPTKNRRSRKVPHWFLSVDETFEIIDNLAPVQPQTLSRSIQKACQKLGYPKFNWHSLRHTFISRCIKNGRSLAEVRDAAGHSSIAITDKYISHSDFGSADSEIFKPVGGE